MRLENILLTWGSCLETVHSFGSTFIVGVLLEMVFEITYSAPRKSRYPEYCSLRECEIELS